MANPVCTWCEQYEAVLLATNLQDGDTSAICANDLMAYSLSMAAAFTEGMTAEQASAYGEILDAIYAHDPRNPKPPPASKPRKTRRQPPPDVPPDGPQGDAAATIALVPPCATCGSETATGDAYKLVCDGCGTVIATADGGDNPRPALSVVTKSDVAPQDE